MLPFQVSILPAAQAPNCRIFCFSSSHTPFLIHQQVFWVLIFKVHPRSERSSAPHHCPLSPGEHGCLVPAVPTFACSRQFSHGSQSALSTPESGHGAPWLKTPICWPEYNARPGLIWSSLWVPFTHRTLTRSEDTLVTLPSPQTYQERGLQTRLNGLREGRGVGFLKPSAEAAFILYGLVPLPGSPLTVSSHGPWPCLPLSVFRTQPVLSTQKGIPFG